MGKPVDLHGIGTVWGRPAEYGEQKRNAAPGPFRAGEIFVIAIEKFLPPDTIADNGAAFFRQDHGTCAGAVLNFAFFHGFSLPLDFDRPADCPDALRGRGDCFACSTFAPLFVPFKDSDRKRDCFA